MIDGLHDLIGLGLVAALVAVAIIDLKIYRLLNRGTLLTFAAPAKPTEDRATEDKPANPKLYRSHRFQRNHFSASDAQMAERMGYFNDEAERDPRASRTQPMVKSTRQTRYKLEHTAAPTYRRTPMEFDDDEEPQPPHPDFWPGAEYKEPEECNIHDPAGGECNVPGHTGNTDPHPKKRGDDAKPGDRLSALMNDKQDGPYETDETLQGGAECKCGCQTDDTPPRTVAFSGVPLSQDNRDT